MADDDTTQPSTVEAELRARVDDLERQLVAYDAALNGDLALAESVCPGAFFLKRKHSSVRLSPAMLRSAFTPPRRPVIGDASPAASVARELRAMSHELGRDDVVDGLRQRIFDLAHEADRACALWDDLGRMVDDDDAAFMRWLWTEVKPMTKFMSCALPEGNRYHPRVDLAANVQAMPDPVSGAPLLPSHTCLPKSGQSGLPRDWEWLVTSWRLELRGTDGWDCGGLEGNLRFSYFNRPVGTRPLSDALVPRDDDLIVHMRENMDFAFEAEFQRGVERIGDGDGPAPRLYVFMDVIARQSVV